MKNSDGKERGVESPSYRVSNAWLMNLMLSEELEHYIANDLSMYLPQFYPSYSHMQKLLSKLPRKVLKKIRYGSPSARVYLREIAFRLTHDSEFYMEFFFDHVLHKLMTAPPEVQRYFSDAHVKNEVISHLLLVGEKRVIFTARLDDLIRKGNAIRQLRIE